MWLLQTFAASVLARDTAELVVGIAFGGAVDITAGVVFNVINDLMYVLIFMLQIIIVVPRERVVMIGRN